MNCKPWSRGPFPFPCLRLNGAWNQPENVGAGRISKKEILVTLHRPRTEWGTSSAVLLRAEQRRKGQEPWSVLVSPCSPA